MSDIVFDLRKNSKKIAIFGILFGITVILAIIMASRVNSAVHGLRYIMTGLACKKMRPFGFFIISVLSVFMWAVCIIFVSACPKIFKLWPCLFLIRILVRAYDVIIALRFYFFSAFISILIFVLIDLIIDALFLIIYFDMDEKSINIGKCGNWHLSKAVVLPVLVLIVVLSCVQTILVPIFVI